MSVNYDERSGKSSTSKTDENIHKNKEMLVNNCRLTIEEVVDDMNFFLDQFKIFWLMI